jgi:hypothetical protein
MWTALFFGRVTCLYLFNPGSCTNWPTDYTREVLLGRAFLKVPAALMRRSYVIEAGEWSRMSVPDKINKSKNKIHKRDAASQ